MKKWIETTGDKWNCAIISSNYDKSLNTYYELLQEAKKDFGRLTPDDVQCLEVVNSIRHKGKSMIHFQIKPINCIPNGWFTSEYVEELKR